jgi:hypothetical protein
VRKKRTVGPALAKINASTKPAENTSDLKPGRLAGNSAVIPARTHASR